MASMFEKLKAGFKGKAEVQHTDQLDVYKASLKKLVYDDELVETLAPIFAKLHGQEGFDQVYQLLQDKETQLELIAGGTWGDADEDGDEDEDVIEPNKQKKQVDPEFKTAEQMLAEKYATNS